MAIKVNQEWWKSLFDDVYLLTDARSVCDDEITRKEIGLILELVPIFKEDRILDLCGGHGRHSLELCKRGYKCLTVLDYSKYLIEYGNARAAFQNFQIEFVRADARRTGYPHHSFEHVFILGNSLGYMPEEESDEEILMEAFRILKQDGFLIIDTVSGENINSRFNPNAWHEIGSDIVVCREREKNGDTITTREIVIDKKKGVIRDEAYFIRLYKPDTLISIVEKAGFGNVKAYTNISMQNKEGDHGLMENRIIITAQKT